MTNYSTTKQEEVDTITVGGCILTLLAKNWITISLWFLTLALGAYVLYKHGTLVASGWIVGFIWATVALWLSICISIESGANHRLLKLIKKYAKLERLQADQISRYRKTLEGVCNGFKAQTVQESQARDA